MITPIREELAWAAGFFDGEGCSSISRHTKVRRGCVFGPYLQLSVTISQAADAAETLHRFHRAVGGIGGIYGVTPQSPDKATHGRKPQLRWLVSSREGGQAVIAMLWPFLSTPKREQASQCLRALRNTRKDESQ